MVLGKHPGRQPLRDEIQSLTTRHTSTPADTGRVTRMGKRHKQLGGNSHQRSVARAMGETGTPMPAAAVVSQKTKTMLEIAFSWPVISTVAILITASGLGVLSMSPPETKIASVLFSIGFPLLLIKLCVWIAFERSESFPEKAFFIGLVCAASGVLWFACVAFANSKVPHNGPQVLTFDVMAVGILNMPERKSVTHTWDGKLWDEEHYSDVRLNIHNTSRSRVQNIDVTLTVKADAADPTQYVMAAIDQLSQIPGVEFPRPQAPEFKLRLRGKDNNLYNLPFPPPNTFPGWGTLPVPSLKVFVPKLLDGEQLKLIIGASTTTAPLKRTPKQIEISGSYDVIGEGTTQRTTLNQSVEVKP